MVHLKPGRLFWVVLAFFEVEFPDLEIKVTWVETCDILLDLHSELEGSYDRDLFKDWKIVQIWQSQIKLLPL